MEEAEILKEPDEGTRGGAKRATLIAEELMTLGSPGQDLAAQVQIQLVIMMIPWEVDTCISACPASMPPYSGHSTLIFLWDPHLTPVLVHVIRMEADPTSWPKECGLYLWS